MDPYVKASELKRRLRAKKSRAVHIFELKNLDLQKSFAKRSVGTNRHYSSKRDLVRP